MGVNITKDIDDEAKLQLNNNIFNYLIEITSDTLDCLFVMWLIHFGMCEKSEIIKARYLYN